VASASCSVSISRRSALRSGISIQGDAREIRFAAELRRIAADPRWRSPPASARHHEACHPASIRLPEVASMRSSAGPRLPLPSRRSATGCSRPARAMLRSTFGGLRHRQAVWRRSAAAILRWTHTRRDRPRGVSKESPRPADCTPRTRHHGLNAQGDVSRSGSPATARTKGFVSPVARASTNAPWTLMIASSARRRARPAGSPASRAAAANESRQAA
jgi:hypothetical protein